MREKIYKILFCFLLFVFISVTFFIVDNIDVIGARLKSEFGPNKKLVKDLQLINKQPQNKQKVYFITDLDRKPLNDNLYKSVEKYSSDYLKVKNLDDTVSIINTKGEVLLSAQKIDRICGYYFLLNDNKYEIYNDKFIKVFDFVSEVPPRIYSDYQLIIIRKDNKYKAFDFDGNLIANLPYPEIYSVEKINDSLFFTAKNIDYKFGVVDKANNVIIPFVFNSISFNKYKDDYIIMASSSKKYAFYDLKGNFIEDTSKFSDEYWFPKKYVDNKKFNDVQLLTKEQIEFLKPQIYTGKTLPSLYISDFNSQIKSGDFVKLTCDKYRKNFFCKLSPNALSAKYCGKESYYVASKPILKQGKYYYEFQITDGKSKGELNKNTKASLYGIHPDGVNKIDCDFIRNKQIKSGDIIGVAVDLDTKTVHYSINGNWVSNPYFSEDGKKLEYPNHSYYPQFSIAGYNEVLTVNFGNQKFKFKMPDGYKAYNSVK